VNAPHRDALLDDNRARRQLPDAGKYDSIAPVDAFLNRLARVIRTERLLPRKATVLVAVSGGLDSLVLLTALARLKDEFGWRVAAAHFNHQLRGRAADADEQFVGRSCSALRVPCQVGRWLKEERTAATKAGGIEHAARLARRGFLGRVAANAGARHIVLAHHADDQVEHFFVRLLRGAGSRALGGMRRRSRHGPPLNAWLVRPFLDFRRAEIAAWAEAQQLRHREDASNRDPRFMRNRVRHELLPYLTRRFAPAVADLVLRTMRGLADEAEWLRAAAADYLRQPPALRPPFDRCPPALQRHALALQLEAHALKFDSATLETLRAAAGTVVTCPGNHQLVRDELGTLSLHEASNPSFENGSVSVQLAGRAGAAQFRGLEINWSLQAGQRAIQFQAQREFFDADRVGQTVILRPWQAGDRFQPIGMNRPVKLQDLFTNAKVPPTDRRRRVVAATGTGEIFWVEGLRIGERFKLSATTQTRLRWCWRRRPGGGRFSASANAVIS